MSRMFLKKKRKKKNETKDIGENLKIYLKKFIMTV